MSSRSGCLVESIRHPYLLFVSYKLSFTGFNLLLSCAFVTQDSQQNTTMGPHTPTNIASISSSCLTIDVLSLLSLRLSATLILKRLFICLLFTVCLCDFD